MNEPAPWPRAATYFLCLAKESRQRKARPLRRPLRGCLRLAGRAGPWGPAARQAQTVHWTVCVRARLLVRGGGRRTRHDRALRARHVPQTAAPLFSASACAAQRLRGQQRKGSTLAPALSLSRERENYSAERECQRPRGDNSLSPEGRGPGRGVWFDLHAIGGAEKRSGERGLRRKRALARFRRRSTRAAQGSPQGRLRWRAFLCLLSLARQRKQAASRGRRAGALVRSVSHTRARAAREGRRRGANESHLYLP